MYPPPPAAGLPYLDVIRLLRDNSPLPIAAYHVSGALGAGWLAGWLGWVDGWAGARVMFMRYGGLPAGVLQAAL